MNDADDEVLMHASLLCTAICKAAYCVRPVVI